MARPKISTEKVLSILIDAKNEMELGTFNSVLFTNNNSAWSILRPILMQKGIIKKVNNKYKWISINPNVYMAKELYTAFIQKRNLYPSSIIKREVSILKRNNINSKEKKPLTPEKILDILILAKEQMDLGIMNRAVFYANHPQWASINSILIRHGVIRKEYDKYRWLASAPDLKMAKGVITNIKYKSNESRLKKKNYSREMIDKVLKKYNISLSVEHELDELKKESTKSNYDVNDMELFFDDKSKKGYIATDSFSDKIYTLYDKPNNPQPEVSINPSEECYRLAKIIYENEELINIQKETIAKQTEKLSEQEKYITETNKVMRSYLDDIDILEKEFVELKRSIGAYREERDELYGIMENDKQNIDTLEKDIIDLKENIKNQNNIYIKPNSKKIKFLGIPIYSVEY